MSPPRVAALILAAGRSTRMGAENKLLSPIEGVPMVARVADAVLASRASPVVVVSGHDAARVRAALGTRDLHFAHAPDAEAGLARSLAAGIAALEPGSDGALVCLGDMPWVRPDDLDALIDAFSRDPARPVCAPVHASRRGNPVLWPARHFAALAALEGDAGGRVLLERDDVPVCAVPTDHSGVLRDVDAPADLAGLQATCR